MPESFALPFERVAADTERFHRPRCFEQFFPDDFLSLSDIGALLRRLAASEHREVRLFVKGKKADKLFHSMLWKNPPAPDEPLEEWAQRLFKKMSFGIVLNTVSSFDDTILRKFVPFVDAFVREVGYPIGGFELAVFLGNYGYTPFGVHHDTDLDGAFHFFLGPNPKWMHHWTDDSYLAANGSFERNFEPETILDAASSFELAPNDLFFLPGEGLHIGNTPAPSVAVALTFKRSSLDLLGKDILKEVEKELFRGEWDDDHRLVPIDGRQPAASPTLLGQALPPFARQLGLADYLGAKFRRCELRRFSNRGFSPAPRRSPLTADDLERSTLELTPDFPISVEPSETDDGQLEVMARAHSLWTPRHDRVTEMLDAANGGQPIVAREWLRRFDEAGVGDSGRELLSFLYEVRGLKMVEAG